MKRERDNEEEQTGKRIKLVHGTAVSAISDMAVLLSLVPEDIWQDITAHLSEQDRRAAQQVCQLFSRRFAMQTLFSLSSDEKELNIRDINPQALKNRLFECRRLIWALLPPLSDQEDSIIYPIEKTNETLSFLRQFNKDISDAVDAITRAYHEPTKIKNSDDMALEAHQHELAFVESDAPLTRLPPDMWREILSHLGPTHYELVKQVCRFFLQQILLR